jgi:hypothetical protein
MALGSNITKNLIFKLVSYLSAKEGCTLVIQEATNDGDRFVTEDAFGFRYEVQVKMIGRNSSTKFEEVV